MADKLSLNAFGRKILHDSKTKTDECHQLFSFTHLEIPNKEPWRNGKEKVGDDAKD